MSELFENPGDYLSVGTARLFNNAIEKTSEGQKYQESGYYKKALEKYNSALKFYEGFFCFCESKEGGMIFLASQIILLFVMLSFIDKVKKCYDELNEPYKALIFQKKVDEIVETIGKYENKLEPEYLVIYKNTMQASSNKLSDEENAIRDKCRDFVENTYKVEDYSDDPIFIELVANFDKCCSYKTFLVPSKAVSVSSSSSSSSSSCFIATAAYSTSTHPDIDTFRNFRDKKLLTNPVGQGLVSLYYNISPSIANYVKMQPVIKSFLRQQLERLAEWMRSREVKS